MYINTPRKSTIDLKVLELAIFGHPLFDEEIQKEVLDRHGPLKLCNQIQILAISLNKIWNTDKSVAKILELNGAWEIRFEARDTVEDIYRKIDDNLKRVDLLFQFHMDTTRSSTIYQTIAMLILAEKAAGIVIFFTKSNVFIYICTTYP